jgi:hypothetical protein
MVSPALRRKGRLTENHDHGAVESTGHRSYSYLCGLVPVQPPGNVEKLAN